MGQKGTLLGTKSVLAIKSSHRIFRSSDGPGNSQMGQKKKSDQCQEKTQVLGGLRHHRRREGIPRPVQKGERETKETLAGDKKRDIGTQETNVLRAREQRKTSRPSEKRAAAFGGNRPVKRNLING